MKKLILLTGFLYYALLSIAQNEVYSVVEEMPIYPGCETELSKEKIQECSDKAMQRFIKEKTKYPDNSRVSEIEGVVYVGFIINSNGEVSNAEIKRGIPNAPELDTVALNLIGDFPKMIPGKKEGRNVSVSYVLPVKFEKEPQKQEQQYEIVEDLPVWPTCTTEVSKLEKEKCTNLEMMKFVTNSAKEKYPKDLQKQEIGGRAFCRFMVNEVGDVEDVTIVKPTGNTTLDSLSKEIIRSFPRLAPATQYGKPVKVQYTVPVNFK